MAGKKLLNCFVKFKNDCGFYDYFRVVRQEDNLCTLIPISNQKLPIKIRKKVDELEKVQVVKVCLSLKDINNINLALISNEEYNLKHRFTKMFEEAWMMNGHHDECILHVENHKYPHLFYSFGFFAKYLNKNEKTYYRMRIYKLLYQCDKICR